LPIFASRLAGALALSCLAACAGDKPAARPSLDAEAAAAVETVEAAAGPAERIAADLHYLADDRREGREAGTSGYLAAANYVAGRFARLGLEPGADKQWFQTVRLRAARRDMAAAELSLQHTDGAAETLAHLEDYLIGQARTAPDFAVSAPAVFVGYGVVDEVSGYDDYRGVDAKGKIVVVFDGAPAEFDSERRAVLGSGREKFKNAEVRGAVGVINVPTIAFEGRRPWERTIAHPESASMTWVGPDGKAFTPSPAIAATATMSAAGAAKLFAGAPASFEEVRKAQAEGGKVPAFNLPVVVSLKGASAFSETESPNVVAMIEGSDPAEAGEVVVLSAHLDHVGITAPKEGESDGVNNGALDNAIGVATILDVARRFKEGPPPRRTIVFVAVTGEEKGLLGADYFARFPTLGGKRMVANVNLDMPVLLYPFIDVIAFGAEQSSLGDAARRAAETMNIALTPDPIPEESIFTRSDHFRFVEQGVPAIFLFTGFGNGGEAAFGDFLKNRYHKPSDDLSQPIDYDAAARFAELNYRIAADIADAAEAPHWNSGQYFADRYGR
jgi:Zn-dependent M28 family amino/carboxypeptidase